MAARIAAATVADPRRAASHGEAGAAGVVAIAIVGATISLAAGVLAILVTSVAAQAAANAADAAALATADARSGAVAGEPCDLAESLARRHGARLLGCETDGPVAEVVVAVERGPVRVSATARAGPPGWIG
ncbi:Rv3654c family TadE-like protein [Agromyces sp. SYSU T0242]|uniref:Rv3654c family TadE-like protein n=1 Tax=Agromyces litoreus TaxID=3158561 RepID=UPI0033958F6B